MVCDDVDPFDILLVEDNPGDIRLAREAFDDEQIETTLHVVGDGVAALDFIFQRNEYTHVPRPDLVLLDLNLPRKHGHEVLMAIHDEPKYRHIPTIVLSGSDVESDIRRSYDLCVNGYLTKPVDADEFLEMLRTFIRFWFSTIRSPGNYDRT